VVLRDSAANGDIHWGQAAAPAAILTGSWQPDGRLSPSGSSRTALLSVFNSSAVPEPEHFVAIAGASLLGFALVRRSGRR